MTMFDDLQLFSGICLISVCLLAQYMLDLAKVKAYSKLLLFSSFVVVANVLKGVGAYINLFLFLIVIGSLSSMSVIANHRYTGISPIWTPTFTGILG